MDWTPYTLFIAFLMVLTGTLNTLTTKWADRIESKSSDGQIRNFNHPFTQSLVMFIGEIMCLLAFKLVYKLLSHRNDGSEETHALTAGTRAFPVTIFFIPAMCDMVATSIMYVGLTLTYASSFQMLRGSLIVFVALLSVGFLERKINSREWLGIFFVIAGLAVVGIADFISQKGTNSINSVITGDLLIVIAQVITAVQMVVEEKFVSGRNIAPLQAVGWEGVFGFTILALLHIPFYFIYVGKPFSNNPRMVLEDLPDALVQIKNNLMLLLPITGTVISIAFFNFAGITVTKEISATTRTVLDSIRTLFIWLATLALGWQPFSPIQILGFFLLVTGMFIYYDIFVTAWIRQIVQVYQNTSRRTNSYRHEVLINQPADEPATP